MKNGIYTFLCLILFTAAAGQVVAQQKVPASNASQINGAAQKKSFVLKGWGLIGPDLIGDHPTAWKIYKDMLQKYNITFKWIGGCTYVEDKAGAVASNNLTIKAIEAEYGVGILEKVRRQADAEYESKYGPADRKQWAKAMEELQQRIEFVNQHRREHENISQLP